MSKRVTVYDIAQELGISPSTVSRVLNNSALISDERKEQILETAGRLGYEKRTIRKHVSRAILNIHLFLPRAESTLIHFFYNISELIDSIQEGFGEVRLNITARVNDGNMEFLSRKKTGQIDGCIFAFTRPGEELSSALNSRNIPSILLNRQDPAANYVCYDTAEGMKKLAEVLADRRGPDLNPCYLGFRGLPLVSRDRHIGAAEVFDARGIPFGKDHCLEVTDLKEIPGRILDRISRGGFNAVLAFNDMAALSVLQAATARGIRVPEDLALTGFDNSPLQALMDRRIDTISLSIPVLGRRAGAWLKGRIIDREEEALREILPAVFVPGDTIG